MLTTTYLLMALTAAAVAGEGVDLFPRQLPNGELPGWKWFCEEPECPIGDVWSLEDGVLQCKGTPRGYLYTEKDYTDFILELEWRWPKDRPGNGGVLLRTTAPHKIWPRCLEAQINADNAGDFWTIGGYRVTGEHPRRKTVEHAVFGTLVNLVKAEHAEKPAGEWNHYRIVVQGDTVTLWVNGKQVNRATGCEVLPGKICLTAEGDAIAFRNVRLIPLDKAE